MGIVPPMTTTSTKTCTVCGSTKPRDQFAKKGDGKKGSKGERRRSYCKGCTRFKQKGVDAPTGLAMERGKCAICQEQAQVIDHDHKTGKARGGLCHRCNSGLGQFHDDPELLQSAIGYLAKH